ncbi:MAG: MraY family glycosyltransferase [Planctomycetota bacterium]
MILPLVSLSIALVLALIAVPLLSRFAAKPLGLLDQPDNNRKLHKNAIPLVGGIAVFLSVALTGIAVFVADRYSGNALVFKPGDLSQFLGLLFGSAFLLLVGVVDDSIGLRGRQKLLGQIIAISILIAFGFSIDKMTLWGQDIEFGIFSMAIVFVWCLAVTNSINLLDGADGFAATIGIVMSLAMLIMALYHPQGRMFDAVLIAALAGALVGFLRYNFPPARVFLGDAGSMLIGFILAAISIRCTFKQHTTYAFFAPIALLAIPFLDTAAAIIRRKLTGRSIYAVDRGHLHHSLMKRGFGPRVSLIWVAFLCATTAGGGAISFVSQQSEYALVSIVIVMLVMVSGRLFGVAEVELVSNKALSIGKAIVKGKNKSKEDNIYQTTIQLQGHRNWKDIWGDLVEFSEDHDLNQITFDINLPWLHESFHAKRRKTDIKNIENDEWTTEIPLIVEKKIFGRVEVLASKESKFSHHDIISNLLKLTSDIEQILLSKTKAEPTPSDASASIGIEPRVSESQIADSVVDSDATTAK